VPVEVESGPLILHLLTKQAVERVDEGSVTEGHGGISGETALYVMAATSATGSKGPLSPRETEVLHLLAEGLQTAEIAERLYISRATVRNHVKSILRKLGVHHRLAAVMAAIRAHLT
jgi:DNA-binding NarL/FixJ family response regulator